MWKLQNWRSKNHDLMNCSMKHYYRPQRSWGKVIFSEACAKNSVQKEGVCPIASWDATPPDQRQAPPRARCRHPPGTRGRHPPGAEPPSPGTRDRHPPYPGTDPQHSACWEIRATSGRYASYWNVILFTSLSETKTVAVTKSDLSWM